MQNPSNSPTQTRLLSDMEKCSEIVYSLLEVDQKQSKQSRKQILSEAKLSTADKTQSRHHRKKVAVTQNPPPAKRQATTSRVVSKQTPLPLSTKHKPDDLPTKLSPSPSDVTIKSTATDCSRPPTSLTASPGDTRPAAPFSSQTSSHLLSLATQRLMQSLALRLDPAKNSLPSGCQALLPQLMAVIQLIDATNPNPLPQPLSSEARPLSLCSSDLKSHSYSHIPVRHEIGTSTDWTAPASLAPERDQLRDELRRVSEERRHLSEQCQRMESCLRRLRTNRDDLAHQLSETKRQRNSLSATLQQLKTELSEFEDRNRSYVTELERGSEVYRASVRSLGSSIQLLDPSVTHGPELDSLSIGSHVSETIIAKEAELRRVKSKCNEYRDMLTHTHANLVRNIRDMKVSPPMCVTETVRELDNFLQLGRTTDSSSVSSINGYVRQTPDKLPKQTIAPVSSTLNNESEFEDRLYQLDAQISKLQLNINQSRDKLN